MTPSRLDDLSNHWPNFHARAAATACGPRPGRRAFWDAVDGSSADGEDLHQVGMVRSPCVYADQVSLLACNQLRLAAFEPVGSSPTRPTLFNLMFLLAC